MSNEIETLFIALPFEDKREIILHGTALYLSTLKKRLFLAIAKIEQFEKKYQISLDKLDSEGLPDDADYHRHEDFILWHHWADTGKKLKEQINSLNKLHPQT